MFFTRFVYSQELMLSAYLSNITDINAFFNQTAGSLIKHYEQGDYKIFPFLSLYSDTYWNMLSDSQYKDTTQVFNIMAGSFFRINKYLSIPISFTYSGPSITHYDNDYYSIVSQNLLLNSGLILETKFVSLGGFVGWAAGYNQYSYDDTDKKLKVERNEHSKLAYSIIPIIKTSESSFLGQFIKNIDGFFGMDIVDNSISWSSISYSLTIISQPITFNEWSILSIAPYISRTPFNLEADNEIYGLKTGINIQDKFTLLMDGGYKRYFNINGDAFSYKDTPYMRLTFPLWLRENGDWLGPTVYIDNALYTTKIGITGKQYKFPYTLEMSFYPYISVTAICTIIFADVFPSRQKTHID